MTAADPDRLHWSALASVSVYNYSTLLGGPLGEEAGWRGYALPWLAAALGPVRASIVLGVLWVGWHLPLFFYPGWSTAPVSMCWHQSPRTRASTRSRDGWPDCSRKRDPRSESASRRYLRHAVWLLVRSWSGWRGEGCFTKADETVGLYLIPDP